MATAQMQPPVRRGSFDYLLSRSIWFQGALMTIHADAADTRGDFAMIEITGAAGGEPPRHVHENEDELFFVLEGHLKAFRGEEELILEAGDAALLPRGIPHSFKIQSKTARWLLYITPGGFEEFFRELSAPAKNLAPPKNHPVPDKDKMVRVAKRFGLTFVS